MTPERWARIKEVLGAALEKAPDERPGYLGETCGSDPSLRREVESLLAQPQESGLKSPVEAGILSEFSAGQMLGRYRVETKLGQGGMGAVYRAHDTVLRRPVALKVLPAWRFTDPESKQRLMREARAASALNHPHIVTIHDIDQADGVDFIAMEYVAGRTLDQVIPHRGLRLSETLNYAVQIADALVAAHAAGIAHRDIKPSNIVVSDQGQVKVLDFGLAKVTRPAGTGPEASSQGPTALSTEGMIVGTAAYMSPEQAEGKAVDARSDIFSLGSVLYEMTTGRRAFSGDTKVSTLAAILHEEPKPVSQIAPETAPELERVVNRCLRKDPARRFQHMADLKVALEEIREESESSPSTAVETRLQRRRKAAWIGAALAVVGLGAWFTWGRRAPPLPPPRVGAFAARAGIEWGPALSPDGKQMAFVWNGQRQDNNDIYVQLLDEAMPRRLTNDPAFDYSPVWSPDGLRISFLRDTPAGTEVLTIPAAGGAERRLHVSSAWCQFPTPRMAQEYCGLGWSPDGRFLTIVDRETPQSPNSIFLLDIETCERRRLTSPPSGWFGDGVSVFSPNGRMLAFTRTRSTYPHDLYVLPLSDRYEPRGEPRPLTRDNTLICGLDWTADGRSVVFSSMRGGPSALWRVGISGGEPERLTVGSENALWPSVARKRDRLAYAHMIFDTNVWRSAAPGGGAATTPVRLTQSPLWDIAPAFSPDGNKVAWASNQSGSSEVWTCVSDGSQPTRLTSLRLDAIFPQWSPNGRQIAFYTSTGGHPHVYAVGADGGAPRRLTTGDAPELRPSWSRDGKWVYFTSDRGEGWAVWKVPPAGGSPVLVVRKALPPVFESFDAQFVYYDGFDGRIWKVPAAGGEPTPVRDKGNRALWTISATGIYILEPDVVGGPAVEFFPFAPGRHSETLRLGGEPNAYLVGLNLAVSPDGRWMLYSHLDRNEGDVMLVENLR